MRAGNGLLALVALVVALSAAPANAVTNYNVTSLADDGGGANLTLREAVEAANLNTAADVINFDPTVATGTIALTSSLNITQPVHIEGPGSGWGAGAGAPTILLNTGDHQVTFTGDGVQIHDLAIVGNAINYPIGVVGDNAMLANNYFGLLPDGTAPTTRGHGIYIADTASGTRIYQNVIAQKYDGVTVGGDNTLLDSNYFGLTPDGTTVVPNQRGIAIGPSAAGTRVGTGNSPNVIAGSTLAGVTILGSTDTQVGPNTIGLNAAGTAAAPNEHGVWVQGNNASGVKIGHENDPGYRNVIAGNTDHGILVGTGDTATVGIYGNLIGLRADGNAQANAVGVGVYEGSVAIGSGASAGRNVISGNSGAGVLVEGPESDGDPTGRVDARGNYVGTSPAGLADRGNGGPGFLIKGSSSLIEGDGAGSTLISGNDGGGVVVADGTSNLVFGAWVGLGADKSALGNTDSGVTSSTDRTQIGSVVPGKGNVIAANSGYGVHLTGAGTFFNRVMSNRIGTIDGLNRGNAADGILINGGAAHNIVGGAGAGDGNEIAYSGNHKGLAVFDGATANSGIGNSIRGNVFHDLGFGSPSFAIDLFGVNLHDANDAGDGDTGGNERQNHPVITAARYLGSDLRLYGNLSTVPTAGVYDIDVFTATSCQDTLASGQAFGPGEGTYFADSVRVHKDAVPTQSFAHTVPMPGSPAGLQVVTTATAYATGSTSEFSECVTAQPGSTVRIGEVGASVGEGAGTLNVPLVRTIAAGDTSATVPVTVSAGSATEGADYGAAPAQAIFAAGSTTTTLAIPIVQDSADEAVETFTVTLGVPDGIDFLVPPSSQTFSIADDDEPATSSDPGDGTVPPPVDESPLSPGAPTLDPGAGPAATQLPLVSGLGFKARTRRRGTITFTLSVAGRVRITLRRSLSGRRVGTRCVKPTARNRALPRCRRTVSVRGAVVVAAKRGRNSTLFSGRMAGKRVAAGVYALVVTPVDANGKLGKPATKKIVLKR